MPARADHIVRCSTTEPDFDAAGPLARRRSSSATRPIGTRCSLLVAREHAGFYRLTCTCGDIRAIHSTRDGATREAVRHDEATSYGYSVTQR